MNKKKVYLLTEAIRSTVLAGLAATARNCTLEAEVEGPDEIGAALPKAPGGARLADDVPPDVYAAKRPRDAQLRGIVMTVVCTLFSKPFATLAPFALSTAIATVGCGSDATGTSPAPAPGPDAELVPEPPARSPRPSFCPQSFVRAEDGGCEPVLPAEPCADNSFPVLGSSACRPSGV